MTCRQAGVHLKSASLSKADFRIVRRTVMSVRFDFGKISLLLSFSERK